MICEWKIPETIVGKANASDEFILKMAFYLQYNLIKQYGTYSS